MERSCIMQTLMKEIRGEFQSFIDDPQHRLLIVACASEHSALLLKNIDAIEQDPASPDIFLTFGHPFTKAEAYVKELLPSLQKQYDQVNEEFAKRGQSGLGPFPLESGNALLMPEVNLWGVVQHIRNVVPKDRKVVWILYPLEIQEAEEYLQLIDYVRGEIERRSLRGVKLIVHETQGQLLTQKLKQRPEVRIYHPSLDPGSIVKKLNEQANNPQVPPEERAQNHMMLAGLDVSQGRFDQALARNQELLGYFYFTGQKQHQSIVLSNIGDIHYTQSRYPDAQKSYENAILISVEEKAQPLVIYQSINLGNTHLMQKRYDEALIYYDSAEKLAEANKALPYQIQALEQIGVTKQQLGKPKEAAEAWEKAVELCKKFRYEMGMRSTLERLRDLYAGTGDTERMKLCQQELAKLSNGPT